MLVGSYRLSKHQSHPVSDYLIPYSFKILNSKSLFSSLVLSCPLFRQPVVLLEEYFSLYLESHLVVVCVLYLKLFSVPIKSARVGATVYKPLASVNRYQYPRILLSRLMTFFSSIYLRYARSLIEAKIRKNYLVSKIFSITL